MSKQFCCYSPNGTPPEKLTECECPFFGLPPFRQLHVDSGGIAWCDLHAPLKQEIAAPTRAPEPFANIAGEVFRRGRSSAGDRVDLRRTRWRQAVQLDALRREMGSISIAEIDFSEAEFGAGISASFSIGSRSIKLCRAKVEGDVHFPSIEAEIDLSDASIGGKLDVSDKNGRALLLQRTKVAGACTLVTFGGGEKGIDLTGARFGSDLTVRSERHFAGRLIASELEAAGNVQILFPSCDDGRLEMPKVRIGGALTIHSSTIAEIDISNGACKSISLRGLVTKTAHLHSVEVAEDFDASTAKFQCSGSFRCSKMGNNANFGNATFFSICDFAGAKFGDVANFLGASFLSTVVFANARFDGLLLLEADSDLSTKGLPEIHFAGALFKGGAHFTNREFTGPTRFSKCRFERAPSFHGCKFHQDTDFNGAAFNDVSSPGAPAAYRTLKLAMESARAKNEEAMFYALEQRSLRHQMKGSPFVRALSWLYDWGSDYGRSIGLPLIWFAVVAGLAGSAYWASLHWEITNLASYCLKEGDPSLSQHEVAIRHMLTQIVRPFEALTLRSGSGESRCVVPAGLAALSTVQTILHLGTIALLFLAIRRRFKMD